MIRAWTMTAALALATAVADPARATEDAACRPDERGPALRVTLVGLKDRRGTVRLELYPPDDRDFLGDDRALTAAGKTFRRVMIPTPQAGEVSLCVRAPAPGRYAAAVIHDRRGGTLKFSPWTDGAGFPGDPRLGRSSPKAASAAVEVGTGVTEIPVLMNYWSGGLTFGPLRSP
jgi:uncharacterized protein (DUF2141 family)